MTTMDTDSESQDSDDGRRFRFEATRKKPVLLTPVKLPEKKSEIDYRSRSVDKDRKDRKNDSNYDSERRQSTYRKSDSGRQREDKRNNELKHDSRRSKHHSHSSKRNKDRDRDNHYRQRSQERSHDRSSGDNRRSKCYEKYEHRPRRRSRERLHQPSGTRSPDNEKSRDISRKSKHEKIKITKDKSPLSKNLEQINSDSESYSSKELKLKNQNCSDLDFSDFDILSELDENLPDSETKTSPKHKHFQEYEKKSPNIITESSKHKISEKYSRRRREENKTSNRKNSNDFSDSENEDKYGPALPPKLPRFTKGDELHASKRSIQEEVSLETETNNEVKIMGPTLSQNLENSNECSGQKKIYGPIIEEKFEECNEHLNSEDKDSIGPTLPPHLKLKEKINNDDTIIGPILPSDLQPVEEKVQPKVQQESESEDDMIGPLPMDHPAMKNNTVHETLEYRARKIKEGFREKNDDNEEKREEWMTELPEVQAANLGLGPRKFRLRPGPDMSDRSCWTDTPAKKLKKQKELEEKAMYNIVEPTHISEPQKEKPTKHKKDKSLMELHQEKLKKKKKKEEKKAKAEGKPIRRPFDRDLDLQVNKFDEARKKNFLKKTHNLDDRFSRGGM